MRSKTKVVDRASPKTHKAATHYHHGDLRQACLQGALSFIEQGESNFSLRDLARKIGVSHQAPYHHFKSLGELLASLAQEGHAEFASILLQARSKAKGRVLPAMGLAYTRFAYDKPHHYRLMFLDSRVRIEEHPGLRAEAERSFGELIKGVEHDHGSQNLSSKQILSKAAAVWSFTHGLSCLLLDGHLGICGLKAPLSKKDFEGLSPA